VITVLCSWSGGPAGLNCTMMHGLIKFKDKQYTNKRNNEACSRNIFFLWWKGNKYYIFWVFVWSIIYPACKANALYYTIVWGLFVSTIFFLHYFITADFRKKKVTVHKMYVLIFSTTMTEISLILRRLQLDIIIRLHNSLHKVPIIFVVF